MKMVSTNGPDLEVLRYPVGRFVLPQTLGSSERSVALDTLGALPLQLRRSVDGLSDAQLDTPYRSGGWTVRQLVHHVADSHANAYTCVRLALTQAWPTVNPYDEAAWAELSDARRMPPSVSLDLLTALHCRWVELFASLDKAQWDRGYLHPETGKRTLLQVLAGYAWHGRHHVAHVMQLRARRLW
jgi:DinB superfamily